MVDVKITRNDGTVSNHEFSFIESLTEIKRYATSGEDIMFELTGKTSLTLEHGTIEFAARK